MTDGPTLRRRLRTTATWTLAVLLALAFLGAGVPKLLGLETPSGSAADFERWGYPDWSRPLVGAGETLAALLLLLPRPRILGAAPRFWAALGLCLDMVGAAATHLAHGEGTAAAFPLTLLALAAALALATRPARAPSRAAAPAPAGGGAP